MLMLARQAALRTMYKGSHQSWLLYFSYYQPLDSIPRLSDIPTRLSGWFQHSSATNLSLLYPINTIPLPSGSPKGNSSALLTVAKHSKGHLDKAMRYLIDSDYIPDKKRR